MKKRRLKKKAEEEAEKNERRKRKKKTEEENDRPFTQKNQSDTGSKGNFTECKKSAAGREKDESGS